MSGSDVRWLVPVMGYEFLTFGFNQLMAATIVAKKLHMPVVPYLPAKQVALYRSKDGNWTRITDTRPV